MRGKNNFGQDFCVSGIFGQALKVLKNFDKQTIKRFQKISLFSHFSELGLNLNFSPVC